MPGSAGVHVEARSRRGACPSVHAPFEEPDGALARVRLPGGRLAPASAAALAAAAARVGAGAVELTNRANVQVRGLPPAAVPDLRDALIGAGLVARDPRVDERRNVLASPTAGVDRFELVDVGAAVAAVLERLASPAARGISPKFGVLVDGGGEVGVRGRVHDLALGALRTADGDVRFEVRLADALPENDAAREVAWTVEPAAVPDLVDAVLAVCAPYGRVTNAIASRGSDRIADEIRRRAGDVSTRRDVCTRAPRPRPVDPVGIHAQRDGGRVWVGARAVLGRLDVPQLAALARVAAVRGSEIRVTPWRGVVLTDVRREHGALAARELEQLGLVCDPGHPANVVVACAGSTGCAAGLVDAQRDARAVIDALAVLPRARRPASVHVSGCDKGCACPSPAEVSLVGTGPDRYDVFVDAFGAEARFGLRRTAAEMLRDAIRTALDTRARA